MPINTSGTLPRAIAALALLGTTLTSSPQSVSPIASAATPQLTNTLERSGRGRGNHTPPSGVLKHTQSPLFWEGRVGPEDAPRGGEPVECASVPCDRFRLKIDLPFGTFRNPNRPGGVQVALRWFGDAAGHTLPPGVPGCCGEFDTLHLWIYKDGALVGSSAGIIAVSQSAFLPDPDNGWYDIWIAYDPSYNVAPFVEYEALAEVEYLPKIHPTRRLLPDLTFRGTERISFDTPSFPIFEPDPPPGSTCFLSEMQEDGAQTCLRFDQIIANRGEGPVEIAWTVPTGSTPDEDVELPVSQRIYRSDGSHRDRPAGTVNYHTIHGHYHYSSFANALLWRSNKRGAQLGSAPVAASHKVSFCMADIRIDAWGEKGDGPRKYYAPDCLLPQTSNGGIDEFRQGINNGWSDVYDWYIPDQYIEVTGVPSGYYRLEFCADPFNEIEEADESNNCIVNHVRLSGMEGPNKKVEVLGTIPPPRR
jgi:lysyl oxidase